MLHTVPRLCERMDEKVSLVGVGENDVNRCECQKVVALSQGTKRKSSFGVTLESLGNAAAQRCGYRAMAARKACGRSRAGRAARVRGLARE